MTPSVGHLQPTWVKALVIDDGQTKFCFVTVDAIGRNARFTFVNRDKCWCLCLYSGADGTLRRTAWERARDMGFSLPLDNVTLHGSHTHSGPGAIAPELLWELAPATDILVPGKIFYIFSLLLIGANS